MSELSGFAAAQKLGTDLGPQSLRVPTSKADAIAQAAQILEGLWDAVEGGLSRNVRIEILKPEGGPTYCTIAPLQPNAIDRPVANPGDWMAVDGIRLTPMRNDQYAGRFTQNVPLEWDGTVAAELLDSGQVRLTFPQPTSANRPFTYSVRDSEGTAVPTVGDVQLDGTTVILTADTALTNPGDSETIIVSVATQYTGVEADSTPVTVTVPEPDLPAPPEPGSEDNGS